NRLWGAERIRGELLKLGIAVSNRSIRRYRWCGADRPRTQSWRTFLANHRPRIWAADLLTVQTLTVRTLYVLVFVAHGRREFGPLRGHGPPDRRLGLAPADQRDPVGPHAGVPRSRSRRRVRRRLRAEGRGVGDPHAAHTRAGSPRERHRRAARGHA